MSHEKLLLAFDAGTGSGRCLVFDSRGNRQAKAARLWKYHGSVGERLTFDPQEWWSVLVELCREVLAKVDVSRIAAVTVTSQRHGFVAFDEEDHELFGWPNLDRSVTNRLAEDAAEIIYNLAGRWPGSVHTGSRLAVAPEVLNFLPVSDWILFRLSGIKGSEPTQAAESCLLDIHSGEWSAKAAAFFGLTGLKFPELRSFGTVLGEISPEVARQTGLLAGTPVVVGGADTQCGVLGCGAGFVGRVGLVAGTSAPLTLAVDSPVLDTRYRTITSPGLFPNNWLLESNAFFTGLSYARLRDLVLPGQSFEEIDRELAKIPDWTGIPVYLGASIMNSRRGSLLPWGGFLTQLPVTGLSPNVLLRAALESAACAVRANLEQLSEIAGELLAPDAPIYLGGGAAHGLWGQMIADLCQRPVIVAAEQEVSALGAALGAAVTAKFYPDLASATHAMLHTARTLYPQDVLGLETFYRRWLTGYQGLAELGEKLI